VTGDWSLAEALAKTFNLAQRSGCLKKSTELRVGSGIGDSTLEGGAEQAPGRMFPQGKLVVRLG